MNPSKFEEAEIYLKEVLSMPVELGIKDLNQQLEKDRLVPGLKLIVTGGQAIQSYFSNSPPLRTHDYDLKLVAPKNIPITSTVRTRMMVLSRGITSYLEITLNNYVSKMLTNLKRTIRDKYGLELIDRDGKVFIASTHLRNQLLNIITFKLRGEGKVRTNSIIDVYVVDPEEMDLKAHYATFTGLKGSNPILSEDAGNYYIPLRYINGIPHAGMGYIIWDTFRMIELSKERGSLKLTRYMEKRDAIIQALNNPNERLSCNSMKEYIQECEKTYNECRIKGKRYKTVNNLLVYAMREGLIPSDPSLIRKIRNTYDLNYLCTSIKRLLE